MINRCYSNINDGGGFGFMKDCWFLCQSFHWNKISTFFEGDLEMLKKLFFALYSFVRRMKNMEED